MLKYNTVYLDTELKFLNAFSEDAECQLEIIKYAEQNHDEILVWENALKTYDAEKALVNRIRDRMITWNNLPLRKRLYYLLFSKQFARPY